MASQGFGTHDPLNTAPALLPSEPPRQALQFLGSAQFTAKELLSNEKEETCIQLGLGWESNPGPGEYAHI